jgi:DNA polymerase-4
MSTSAQPDLFTFLHIDLNSFFASVEQQLHPEFRGKPTGVTATMADTGTLIAASYEAKALGIKTGT